MDIYKHPMDTYLTPKAMAYFLPLLAIWGQNRPPANFQKKHANWANIFTPVVKLHKLQEKKRKNHVFSLFIAIFRVFVTIFL